MKRDRQILAFAFSSCVLLFVLFVGQVYAADNLVGGGGFGAKCEDSGEGTNQTTTCSCKPPQTSADCAKLVSRCDTEQVKDWSPGMNGKWTTVPKVICSATECLCKWIGRNIPVSDRFSKIRPGEMQNQVVAPSPKPATNPARLTRYKYTKSVVAKPTEGEEEEEEPQPRAVKPASKNPTVKVERR